MSDEVAMARDELKRARQRARCESALGGNTIEGLWTGWANGVILAVAFMPRDEADAAGFVVLGVLAVVLFAAACRLWWRAGVRSGFDHARRSSDEGATPR